MLDCKKERPDGQGKFSCEILNAKCPLRDYSDPDGVHPTYVDMLDCKIYDEYYSKKENRWPKTKKCHACGAEMPFTAASCPQCSADCTLVEKWVPIPEAHFSYKRYAYRNGTAVFEDAWDTIKS